MVRRTSKKKKEKITLVDVKEPLNMLELLQPTVDDFITRLDEHARERGYLRDYLVGYTGRARCNYIPPRYTGRCSICEILLTTKYPEDFPIEWKICCFCHRIAKLFIEHKATSRNWETPRANKIKKLINLVG